MLATVELLEAKAVIMDEATLGELTSVLGGLMIPNIPCSQWFGIPQ